MASVVPDVRCRSGPIGERQLPHLPGIGGILFSGEQDIFAIEGDVGVGGCREVRNERFGLSLMNQQQLRARGETAPDRATPPAVRRQAPRSR